MPFYASFEAACIGRTTWGGGGGGVVHTYDLQMGNVRDRTKGGMPMTNNKLGGSHGYSGYVSEILSRYRKSHLLFGTKTNFTARGIYRNSSVGI